MSESALTSNTLFDRLTRRSARMRRFDARWTLENTDLAERGLKRQSLASLLLADTGLS